MSDDEVYGELDSTYMEASLCNDCVFRISRELKPLQSAIDIWEESLGIEIDDDTILETHTCEFLGIDLDHIVLKCNKHKTEEEYFFLNTVSRLRTVKNNEDIDKTNTDNVPKTE